MAEAASNSAVRVDGDVEVAGEILTQPSDFQDFQDRRIARLDVEFFERILFRRQLSVPISLRRQVKVLVDEPLHLRRRVDVQAGDVLLVHDRLEAILEFFLRDLDLLCPCFAMAIPSPFPNAEACELG